MKLFSEKSIPRLVIIAPLLTLAAVTVAIVYFYANRFNYYFEAESRRYLKEFVNVEKKQGEEFIKDLGLLLDYKENHIEDDIRKSLVERVDIAYETATYIYDKYHGKLSEDHIKQQINDALHQMVWHGKRNFIWITDFDGNNLLSANEQINGINILDYKDADGKLIIQEEIKIVKKSGSGFLATRFSKNQGRQIMYVRDFGHYGWFFGTGKHIDYTRDELKDSMLLMLNEMPTDKTAFIAVFDKRGPLLVSKGASDYIHDENIRLIQNRLSRKSTWYELPSYKALIYSEYFEPFGWYLVYGFDTTHFSEELSRAIGELSGKIDEERLNIISVSIVIMLFVGMFSLLLSKRINLIFAKYKEEVRLREELLKELNASLEKRVAEEVKHHREKEKMLIQQSKMAAMGDMISMIAHQWRQPLNQLSYVLMNIEGAYEHKELTPKYLKEKIDEGTSQLEFMSHTIDDFRNFFRPDKEREKLVVSDVVEQTIPLIEKSLESKGISLQSLLICNAEVEIFRNELMQVILNIINNAKDALMERGVAPARIMVETYETGQFVVIKICDNAGGIDEEIKERIFEPYFTTKGSDSGNGLGLYMSKTIMEKHLNGELRFENRDGGACFMIKIGKQQFV
jgi:signal transduction histidine kinase